MRLSRDSKIELPIRTLAALGSGIVNILVLFRLMRSLAEMSWSWSWAETSVVRRLSRFVRLSYRYLCFGFTPLGNLLCRYEKKMPCWIISFLVHILIFWSSKQVGEMSR